MNIGDNIKKIRKEKGLTQKQLAEAIGVSTITIQNYENNRRQPNIDMLNKIGSVLDVFIFSFEEENKTDENRKNYSLEQYMYSLGYEIIMDSAEGYVILKAPEGEYEITMNDLSELISSTDSFIKFKISEIINKSRKIGK